MTQIFINQTFDADKNLIFESTRSHRPDNALKENPSVTYNTVE